MTEYEGTLRDVRNMIFRVRRAADNDKNLNMVEDEIKAIVHYVDPIIQALLDPPPGMDLRPLFARIEKNRTGE